MSASHRFIFSTFLFLALCCFAVSSAFAATTHVFYKDLTGTNQCALGYSGFCATAFSRVTRKYQYRYVQEGCDYFGYSDINVRYSETPPSYGPTGLYYDNATKSIDHVTSAQKMTHTCNDGEKFELIGCTAQCVADPCNALKDQEFSGASACGSFSCNTGTLQNGTCDGKVLLTGAASTVTDTNKCIGSLVSNNLTNAFYKTTDNGKASGTAYCSATYKYTGISDTQAPDPLSLAALALYQAVPLPDDGICPADKPQPTNINGIDACIDNKLPDSPCPVQGEKPNSNGVCVSPDDPTYPDDDPTDPTPETGCPAGQIKNNSGVCVPYADATKCPVGQVRDNLGTCSPDPKANSCPVGQVKNITTGLCSNDPRGTGCAGGALLD